MRWFLALLLLLPLAASNVRIIQTNSAGDNVSIIDPATNKVVGVIKGIEVNHGAAAAPDGSRYYISNEAQSTLDVVDTKSLKVTNRIPLSGHPNNIAISKDGRRVYVSIARAPGAVDVVDTASLEKVKSIPVKGAVHNTYVTPDGKWVVAGSIASKTITVISAKTETTRMVSGDGPGNSPDGVHHESRRFHEMDTGSTLRFQRIRCSGFRDAQGNQPGHAPRPACRQAKVYVRRQRVARHGSHARSKDARGQQPAEQFDLSCTRFRI